MEDGLDTVSSVNYSPKNGQLSPVMANCSEEDTTALDKLDTNVDSDTNKSKSDSESSDCDALVIDESIRITKSAKANGKRTFKPKTDNKNIKKSKVSSRVENNSKQLLIKGGSNNQPKPINELVNSEFKQTCLNSSVIRKPINNRSAHKRTLNKKGKGNPQLREYAQYLGLQPTVQFKCVKCKCAGFESLKSLNEHSMQCNASVAVAEPLTHKPTTTQFKIARKVFLCSVCCTYYENWNLFLHMREVHKRFICLYCLGMFSQPEKLCLHLISKHNCVPGQFETAEDFFLKYKDPCYLLCCECEKVFNEQDDFFNHKCVENTSSAKDDNTTIVSSKNCKHNTKPDNLKILEHITGDTLTNLEVKESVKEDINTASNEMNISEDVSVLSGLQNVESLGKKDDSLSSIISLEEKAAVNNNEDSLCTKMKNLKDKTLENIPEEPLKEENTDCFESSSIEGSHKEHFIEVPTFAKHENDPNAEDKYSETGKSDSIVTENVEQSNNTVPIDSVIELETRKVPKVTLKLTNINAYNSEDDDYQESDGSEGLVMELENVESENDLCNNEGSLEKIEDEEEQEDDMNREEQENQAPALQVAGAEIPILELELEQPLDKFEIRTLIQKCLRATISICIYCNHARKIAVNGKQLGLHAIAEHRFSAIVHSITAEELIPESFNARIKDSLHELENVYFNLESNSPEEAITFSHVFECFQCRYSTTVHKELYLHNRKMHAKTILLCIMCKSNFYSYSELISHLCPGLYALDNEVRFRCCMCVSDELPSAFRLMVHLRKKHHACDVCLELCNNQSRLSNHVWKHKLHHFCYRCGIAYRNKPDITKHLFWKHGTESVLCKKCLQKKWPHVYHFCVPPTTFTCEECNLNFSRAVSLMVHKRLHTNDMPHACTFENCTEKFVSKKLLLKHEFKHREPCEEIIAKEELPEEPVKEKEEPDLVHEDGANDAASNKVVEITIEKPPKVDIYDLPELNLSESDSSDSETETSKITESAKKVDSAFDVKDDSNIDILDKPVPILENIWDNFKNYQASKEKTDGIVEFVQNDVELNGHVNVDPVRLLEIIKQDHDYLPLPVIVFDKLENKNEIDLNMDHDYCTANSEEKIPKEAPKVEKVKKETSDSSSNSDSSSCTCGSNCSCSSSSETSSSSSESSGSDSSTSEGRRKKLLRKQERKLAKDKSKKEQKEQHATQKKPVLLEPKPLPPTLYSEVIIQESDLETTETDTDEDFYDDHPQKLAKKLLEEKKNQLMVASEVEPVNGSVLDASRPSTPSLPEEFKPKKKSKSKKRKKKKSKYNLEHTGHRPSIPVKEQKVCETPLVSPITLAISRNSPTINPAYNSPAHTELTPGSSVMHIKFNHKNLSLSETESNLRASKRRRVPNKFYGYSSDEEREKLASPPINKWRRIDHFPLPQQTPLVVPPLTIKTIQPPTPTVEPISIRTTPNTGEFKVHNVQPAIRPLNIKPVVPAVNQQNESGSDSNESSSEEEANFPVPMVKEQPALYCYCRCPYDEVSEMIGCDSSDCAIEWFHFECVGIMVPPKGQWYCPDCRKRKQQQRKDVFQPQNWLIGILSRNVVFHAQFIGLFREFVVHFIKLYKSDGLFDLYREGYFWFFDTTKQLLPDPENVSLILSFIIAETVMITAGLISYPFDTVRTRIENDNAIRTKE